MNALLNLENMTFPFCFSQVPYKMKQYWCSWMGGKHIIMVHGDKSIYI